MTAVASDLACARGGRLVFSGVSLRAGPGQLVAVAGPNGSGKSSLLRILAGLLRPEAGSLRFERDSGGEGDAPVAHFLGHAEGLKGALTLCETLRFWAALYGGDPAETALAAAASRVGIGHAFHLPVGVLSAGQRRRAGLARLLIAPRPLWLLDEPTAALDRDGEALLGELMAEHLSNGGAIIAATHLALPIAPHATLELPAAS